MANAGRSGFCYLVNSAGHSIGNHVLRVVAKSRSGAKKEWTMNFTLVASTRYQKWLKKSEQIYGNKKFRIKVKAKNLYSLLLRIELNPDHALLMQTFKSLAAQTYAKFEIIIIADSSQCSMIADLVEVAGLSSKARFATSSFNDWMSNVAGCRGHLVGLVDVGDVLRPWALNDVDNVFRTSKNVGLVYADEDNLCEGERCKPIFKPGWSPVFLSNCNYIGRPWFALKSVLVSALSSLDSGNRDTNEHLLLKEIGRISTSICHIPTVLISHNNYSINKHEQIEPSKMSAIHNTGIVYPKVSIIIPTRLSDIDLVDRCFAGLNNLTDYPDMEVIIVVNNVSDSSLVDNYLGKWPFKVIHWNDAFSWSGINNFGAAHATGNYLLFMNDDVEPIDKNWLKIMVRTLSITDAAVIGPLLKYPNGTIQHLGINFVDYGSGVHHLFRFCTGTEENLQWLMNFPREVSAVTGACLLTTRKYFDAAMVPIQPASRWVRLPISTENAPGPLSSSFAALAPRTLAKVCWIAVTELCCPVGSKPGAMVSATSNACLPARSNQTSCRRCGAFAGCQDSASFSVSMVGSAEISGSISDAAGEPRSCTRASSASRKLVASKRCVSSVSDNR